MRGNTKSLPATSLPETTLENRTAECDGAAQFDTGQSDTRVEKLAIVLDNYLQQLESGGVPPDLDALVRQHPELEDDLRECAGSLHLLHRMSAGVRQDTSGEDATATPKLNRLGDFAIAREIGRGGMGVVYEARQLSLDRRVALKVLPFAAVLEAKQVTRFRNEAQAAASLHHPNIVPVYGVGDERGVHYFAMQFVEGQSLDHAIAELTQHAVAAGEKAASEPTDVCGTTADLRLAQSAFSTRVSTRSRQYCDSVARLVVQAATALEHAHQCGVIHRDVKPSNLLVDRDGKLWVTDFGLARVEANVGVTVSGDVVGTLRYMSPEQARGKPAPIDARTDVYSLGATLYEMLTLQHAHQAETQADMLEVIDSVEPTPPRSLNHRIPYDLETIVLKAMSKQRDDRYATAGEFADDLQRYLDGRSAVARRPSTVDRLARWAMRHRRMVASVAAGIALVATLASTGFFMVSGALRDSEVSRQTAQQHYAQAREVVDRFGLQLSGELGRLPETGPIRRKLLEETLAYYNQFIEQAGEDESLSGDIAATLHRAGVAADKLGDAPAAQRYYAEAVDKYAELLTTQPSEIPLHEQLVRCQSGLGLSLAGAGQTKEAKAAYRAAAVSIAAMPAGDRRDAVDAELANNWGLLCGQAGDAIAAERHLRRAISLLDGSSAGESATAQRRLANAYNSLSYVQRETDSRAALASNGEAIAILQQILGADGDDLANRSSLKQDLAVCLNNRGALESNLGYGQAAVVSHEAAVDVLERLVRVEPSVVEHRRSLAVNLSNLAEALAETGNTAGASETFARAESLAARLAGDYPASPVLRSLIAGILHNRALRQEASGQLEGARDAYGLAIDHQQAALKLTPSSEGYREQLVKHERGYERVVEQMSDWPEAGKRLAIKSDKLTAEARRFSEAGEGRLGIQVGGEIAQ